MSSRRFLLAVFIILGQDFCDAKQPSVPEAPTLTSSLKGSSVELLCQAPQGSGGVEFKLFRVRQEIDTKKYSSKQREALFVLKGEDAKKENLYCCQYDSSMYSSYISPELKSILVSPPSPPELMVHPSNDYIVTGQTLTFTCQTPTASLNRHPDAFFLIRISRGTLSSKLAPPKLVSRSQQPSFSVKAMGRGDSWEYACLYQLTLPKTGRVNSTASRPVHITVIDLPVPTLSLTQHVLECVGSASYPQASFSLFRLGSTSPEATRQFSLTQHRAQFPISNRYDHDTLYQCQYTVQLGNSHLHSKMSNTVNLPCNKGHCTSPPSGNTGSADLALIIGSVSAGVLFLMVVALLSFAIHRRLKTLAEKRRKREQEHFWQKLHSRDHVVDLPLQSVDCEFQDFRRKPSVSEPIYDIPMSTFTKPPLY
ncbi:alpha-1B-glycoprotein-like [Triplophysa rosa]|uniref:alpha-1B-glycoprotein-like n=1 Tax=Triplophysa rosa TaxID=992332 RepID=UPI00221486B7|nr:alpha-1B-glycoprotein-like [Triplophysa rosa]KAI7807262.1 putative immunoglobulin superfamily member 1-like [Triplophysa rosa]